ncbi:MAG: hypothetical protein FJ276_32910 [Planctomycetes bacterium]|nr:hypothetical protein [Planctomycetota bacterium]
MKVTGAELIGQGRRMVRWLGCTMAFAGLVVVAWKWIVGEKLALSSWRTWVCWLLTIIGAEVYAKRIGKPNE